MRIECIAIGSELLTTKRLDTNSVWIAERLAGLGLGLHRKTAIGDHREDLAELCQEAFWRSDVIICTGGLGPTFDDFTKEVWADTFGVELIEDAQSHEDLVAWYAQRQRVPPPANFKQVLFPEGSRPLANPLGTAPGVVWERGGKIIFMLPGVPREMKRMWLDHVEPHLKPMAGLAMHTLRMVVCGVPESTLDQRTEGIRHRHPHLDWTILAGLAQVEFIVRSVDSGALDVAREELALELGGDLVCVGSGDLESTILDTLESRNETLAVAESMSGGLVASRLTAIPGASRVFLGGAVAYSATAKIALAGLDPAFIQEHGTIGESTTLALAKGIRGRLGTTWGLAITGNAGPTLDAGGIERNLGECALAVVGPRAEEVRTLIVPGDRVDIQLRSAAWALDLLRRAMQTSPLLM
ncbi:MAG: CinA family nicotinamide mononucleotide deamidase-related protein [Holophagaceae bacterium]|nr:CinA family nicotinamide mononucleotide deamidase-related protein [Holophagaceae bacterium]